MSWDTRDFLIVYSNLKKILTKNGCLFWSCLLDRDAQNIIKPGSKQELIPRNVKRSIKVKYIKTKRLGNMPIWG